MKNYTYDELEQDYSPQRAERFAYIDFVLRFLGGLNRSDLLTYFGIGDAAASKEISEYKTLRSENVDYDRVLRKNVILRSTYKPLIDLDSETALGMLANGFNKNKLYTKQRSMLTYCRIGAAPSSLNVECVSKVTRAMHTQTSVKCRYISGNSKNYSDRTLFPTAFFYDGQSWMFRAYHQEDKEFKCFEFARLASVLELDNVSAVASESITADEDWQLIVPLELSLHPGLSVSKKATLRKEFGLEEGEDSFVHMEKAVLVYYLKKHWKIDVADEPAIEGNFKFHWRNGSSFNKLKCMENVFKY